MYPLGVTISMRRLVGLVVLTALPFGLATPAWAGGSSSVALGLAAFAVFNQFLFALTYPPAVYAAPPVYPYGAPAYPYSAYAGYPTYGTSYTYAARPAPAAASGPTVVNYPHGRYELRGDGITVPYQWVWIWNPPPPPAAERPASPAAATR